MFLSADLQKTETCTDRKGGGERDGGERKWEWRRDRHEEEIHGYKIIPPMPVDSGHMWPFFALRDCRKLE